MTERKNFLQCKKVLAMVFVMVLLFSAMPMDVFAAENDTDQFQYSVAAQLPDNQRNTNKSYFDLSMTPSQTQTIEVIINNTSSEPIIVDVNAHNAYTNRVGNIDYTLPEIQDESLKFSFSDIATLAESAIDIPANSQGKAQITLKMPAEQFDGEIIGGFIFTKRLPEKEGTGVNITNQLSYLVGIVLSETDVAVRPEFELVDVYAEMVNYNTAIIIETRNIMPIIAEEVILQTNIYKDGASDPIWTVDQSGMRVAPSSTFPYAYSVGKKLEAGTYLAKIHLESTDQEWDFESTFVIEPAVADDINASSIAMREEEPAFPPLLIVLFAILLVLLVAVIIVLIIVLSKKKKQ